MCERLKRVKNLDRVPRYPPQESAYSARRLYYRFSVLAVNNAGTLSECPCMVKEDKNKRTFLAGGLINL